MKRGWTAVVGVLGLSIALASALLAPLQATATDSDLKHAYAFRVEASNGYSILALASSQRADGRFTTEANGTRRSCICDDPHRLMDI